MPGKKDYGNESISMLKGEDRVRLRPAVIFGSDNLEGCIHSFFEILSNSIDEAREGHGDKIIITRFADGTIEVEDFGRGIPMDYNAKEGRYNWELVYCELYAGGKYNNNSSGDYEFSLGLNGLGACATQYASEFFEVTVFRDHTKYEMGFKKGVPVTELMQEPYRFKRTGTIQRWKPDTEVFTEILIPLDTFKEIIKRQSVINSGIEFVLKDAESGEEFSFIYPEGIKGYVDELNAMKGFTETYTFSGEGKGRDKEDRDEYKVRAEVAFCFNNEINALEYFHNSSFLEHGGSPDKAVRNAFVAEIDKQKTTQRKNRGRLIRVALVGYTNVGKSTMMNLLAKSEVFAENKLFATLDTTVRKMVIDNLPFLLADTVGFIRKLPSDLVESFKSTLDEVREADLLVHVVDISHPDFEEQITVVEKTLADLGCADKPSMLVFNKIDAYTWTPQDEDDLTAPTKENISLEELKKTWMAKMQGDCLFISAKKKENIDELREVLYQKVRELHVQKYPYNDFLYQVEES